MRVDLLDYALPPERIAQHPSPEREAARLMVLPAKGPIAHRTIADLAEHVAPGTLVVVNDTKVIPARILGVKEGSGGKTEIFLVRRLADAGVAHQVDGPLFEHTGPDAFDDVLPAAVLDDDRVDALPEEQVAEHQAGGSGADDANLRARPHGPSADAIRGSRPT